MHSLHTGLKNDEQIPAAQQFITDGVNYLLLFQQLIQQVGTEFSIALKEAGVKVILFDRVVRCR